LGSQSKTVAVITARFNSSRFPGKALALLNNKELLKYLVETVKAAGLPCVIATTDTSPKIIEFCVRNHILCSVSNNEDDLLGRVYYASLGYETVIRLWGDAPFVSPQVIEEAISGYHETNSEYFTFKNLDTGECVAVTSRNLLGKLHRSIDEAEDREWIHTYMSNLPGSITRMRACGGQRMLIDTPEDLNKIREQAWVSLL